MISLLLHQSNAKLMTSVNNKDIIRMHLRYNWLISQRTVPINASFVKQQAMASGYVHLSKLSLYNNLSFFSQVISRYHPVVSDIRFITLQISLMYGFTGIYIVNV